MGEYYTKINIRKQGIKMWRRLYWLRVQFQVFSINILDRFASAKAPKYLRFVS